MTESSGSVETSSGSSPRARELIRLVLPAALVGIASALGLIALSVTADRIQDVLWVDLPGWVGLSGGEAGWTVGMLTVVGVVTGVLIVVLPGHAGPDPATLSLVSPPLSPSILPGLAVVVAVGLAGGVSLGPENPIIAINVALAVWAGQRARLGIAAPQWVSFAAAGTVGALFATPVAAALILSEAPAGTDRRGTWDRLFAPLVAAGTGSLTMYVLARPIFAVSVPAYAGPEWPDLVSGPVIAIAGVACGLVMLAAFPLLHDAFHRLPTIPMLALGGVLLGVLGAIGGQITMFKGLEEMKALVVENDDAGRLALVIGIKTAALLVAATCGFRGGKIFPATFVGVALGLLAHELVDGVPPALAVAAAVMGVVLVVSHSGWLSLFMGVTIVGQVTVLPVLCLALVPAWLLVTDRAEMELEPEEVGACGP